MYNICKYISQSEITNIFIDQIVSHSMIQQKQFPPA